MPFDLDERYVEEAEATLGARLPSAYRAAMKQRNGGVYEMGYRRWFFYPIFDHSDKKRLVRTSNHIVSETNTSRTYDHFPDDALAIANDDEGNHLVLLQSGDHFGEALYEWDHDTGEVVRIASDLSELTPV